MAKQPTNTIPDNKELYFYNKLMREVSHKFVWSNLPDSIPPDFIEQVLCSDTPLLYYHSEEYGPDIAPCSPYGVNRHGRHVMARVNINTDYEQINLDRKALYMSNSKIVKKGNPKTDGVIIYNMPIGHTLREIIEHFVYRLVVAQQAYDTNLAWSNAPYIFQASNADMKLSIEKMFSDILTGKPAVIVDSMLLDSNRDRLGIPSVNLWVKELYDNINELEMGFMRAVGFETSGIEKAERVIEAEVNSNEQHTMAVSQIMLMQRKMAVEAINHYFGENISVDIIKPEEKKEMEVNTYGQSDDRAEGLTRD